MQPAQLLWSLAGLVTVFYLVGVEAVALGVLCAWCTALHVLIVATLLVSLLRTPSAETGADVAPRQERLPRATARAGRPQQ